MPVRFSILLGCALTLIFQTACDRGAKQQTVIIEAEPSVSSLISTFVEGGGTFREILFPEVIEASCGTQVIPVDPNDEVDRLIIDELASALKNTVEVLNHRAGSPDGVRKISEKALYFEKHLIERINAAPGFACDYSRTKQGNLQRSGYPDLRVVHQESGRVSYLDTKLVEQGTLDSSLHTFYFSPKGESGKVLDTAHHLLAGVEHDGNTGEWQFIRWHLIDLANLRVRLKAEFQGSNKDLYKPDLIIKQAEVKNP